MLEFCAKVLCCANKKVLVNFLLSATFLVILANSLALPAQADPTASNIPLAGRLASNGDREKSGGSIDLKKEATYIQSDALTLRTDKRIFVYSGNVKVEHGDITMTCKLLEGSYNEKNQIEQIIAKGEVVVTRGTTKATGGRAVFSNDEQTIVLTENPELEDDGSILTADRVIIFLAEDRSAAEGQVRVKLVSRSK